MPEYDETANGAKNLLIGDFEFLRSEGLRIKKWGLVEPIVDGAPAFWLPSGLHALLTISGLREGYLRALLSMVAITLGVLDDRNRTACRDVLEDFIRGLVRDADISPNDLASVIAELQASVSEGWVLLPDRLTELLRLGAGGQCF